MIKVFRIISTFFIFLLKIQKVVVIYRSRIAVATRSQFDLNISIRLVAVPLAMATHLKIQLWMLHSQKSLVCKITISL